MEFVETPWDSIFAALEANRFDVVANEVTITPERQAEYDLSQPYSVGEGVIVTRADDNSIKSLADLAEGKVAAENATSNWSEEIARKAGARVEAVEGFTQAIKLLNQGRVDVVVNDSIAVYAYLAETNDTSVKIAGTVGEKSEQGFAARKDSGLLPELNTALDQLRADGTLAAISQKYLKANASGEPTQGPTASHSTWQLIADNLWPLARAALTMTIPLTIISFVIGLVIALASGPGQVVAESGAEQHRPLLHLDHPRDTAAGTAVHRVLRAARVRREDRPVPGRGDRVQPQRRRLCGRDHPLGDPEHPEGAGGGPPRRSG